ncbi:MAG: hypothetical protein OHK0026_16210 [Rhodocyclaceae bacterium]
MNPMTDAFDGLRMGLVGPLPPPEGGMANQTRQLAALLEAEGARVELVRTNAPYRPQWAGRLKGIRALARLLPYLFALWRCAGRVRLFHVMANSGWSWHLYALPAILVGRARGVPVLVNYRGGEAARFLERSAWLVRPCMRAASALAVPSGFLREVFAGHGMQSAILPNVVDLARFRYRERPSTHSPRLVVARNLEPLYDIGTALRAFARVRAKIPGARLAVAGAGPEAESLRALAASLAVAEAVEFTGRLDPVAMARLYEDCDLMLNPALADNMPNSVLEALACGLPVVSTRVGGVPWLVEDGVTALLVPPADADAMARAALRLLAEPALARRIVQAGRREVARYEWASVRERLAALYRGVLMSCEAGVTPA